jgi:ADP-ribosylglycohydrolase
MSSDTHSDTGTGIDALDRFRGALLGLAVGDALAFPYKTRKRSFLKTVTRLGTHSYSREESGFYPTGQFTDDTQMAFASVAALTECRAVDGAVITEHLIPLWRDQHAVDSSEAANGVFNELVRGRSLHTTSGLPGGHLEAFGLTGVVPVGLWRSRDSEELVNDVQVVSSIGHRDVRVSATAAGMAAAVAYGVETDEVFLGSFLDSVAAAAGKYDGEVAECVLDFPRILSMTEYRALEQIEKYVSSQTGESYDAFDRGIPDNVLFIFLASLYYFLRSPDGFERAVTSALHAGGEVTTLCALTGSLSGAFLGSSAISEVFTAGLLENERLENEVWEFHVAWEESHDAQ